MLFTVDMARPASARACVTVPDKDSDSLSMSMAPLAICCPFIVPTVRLAQFKLMMSTFDASSVPAMIFPASIFTASRYPVICPSTIVARSISPTFANNAATSATAMLASSISAYLRSAEEAVRYPRLATFTDRLSVVILFAFNVSNSPDLKLI